MRSEQQFRTFVLHITSRAATVTRSSTVVLALMLICTHLVLAQTFQVIHNFTGGQDGAKPMAGLTMDNNGNLYGTTSAGAAGNGTVFKLTHTNSGWILSPLYSFAGGNDGVSPGAVTIGPNHILYGTTFSGGGYECQSSEPSGCGTVFSLRPYPIVCKTSLCPWIETVLYRFTGGSDGAFPNGRLLFDPAGNLYGTAGARGDPEGGGVVYQLSPSESGWTEHVLHSFNGLDGYQPRGGVISDPAGKLYGTTVFGGAYKQGVVYELTPQGSGWTESVLHDFSGIGSGGDGAEPFDGLIFDQSGDFYGTTSYGGGYLHGTVFSGHLDQGLWDVRVLWSFTGLPEAAVTMNAAGDLFGTTNEGGAYNNGSVFKLSKSLGNWVGTSLYDFTGGADGLWPYSNVVLGPDGNLYGTASEGGAYGKGVVWKITP